MSEAPKMTYADKPWLKSYKFGPYPLKKTLEPYPEVPLYQILYDTAEKFPNRPACLAFGKGNQLPYPKRPCGQACNCPCSTGG